jgi:hypothetical protein
VKIASILDVLHAIKAIAPASPEVGSWWYAPPRGLRVKGDLDRCHDAGAATEVVVDGEGLAASRLAPIAADLSCALGGAPATARLHREDGEEHALFRILSARGAPRRTVAPT